MFLSDVLQRILLREFRWQISENVEFTLSFGEFKENKYI